MAELAWELLLEVLMARTGADARRWQRGSERSIEREEWARDAIVSVGVN